MAIILELGIIAKLIAVLIAILSSILVRILVTILGSVLGSVRLVLILRHWYAHRSGGSTTTVTAERPEDEKPEKNTEDDEDDGYRNAMNKSVSISGVQSWSMLTNDNSSDVYVPPATVVVPITRTIILS